MTPPRGLARPLVALLTLASVGCASGAPAPPPSESRNSASSGAPTSGPASAGAPAPALRQLELPTATISATSAPLWVGVDHGLFRRHGLDVEVKGLAPAAATQAVQAGSVPFAATAGSSASAWVSGARDLVFIAGLLNKVLFQLVAQPEVQRVEDLRGKAVGSSTAGSSASTALADVLRSHGLEPDRDVSIVYLRDQPGIFSGLISGQTAAGWMAIPYNKQARAQGYRLLVDTADLDMEILGLNITTTRSLLAREPDLARRFVMGYVEAIQYARREPGGTIESIMRGTQNDDRDLATEAYQLYRRVWEPWPSARALQALIDSLDVPGAQDVQAEQMLDESILRELQASGWLGAHLGPP